MTPIGVRKLENWPMMEKQHSCILLYKVNLNEVDLKRKIYNQEHCIWPQKKCQREFYKWKEKAITS